MSRRHDEHGAILVFGALALVLLLGISALAIDIGVAKEHRRQMQNGADSAALAAAQELVCQPLAPCNPAALLPNATAQAESYAGANLPSSKFTLDWTKCAGDPSNNPLPKPSAVSCISFSNGFTQVRVRVPRQTFASLFAGVLGIRNTSTTTVATAGISPAGNTGLEPFTMLQGFGGGQFCLDSGGGGNSKAPCSGPTTGNFGLLDFASCGLSSGLSDNIAAGADHFYSAHPTGVDPSVADDCQQPGPNSVGPDPGNKVSFENTGMFSSSSFYDGKPGRLLRIPANLGAYNPTWEVTTAGGSSNVDNRPLWEFIPDTTLTGIPQHCQRATFDGTGGVLDTTPPGQQQLALSWALDRCFFEYKCGKLDLSTPATYVPGGENCLDATRAGGPVPECNGNPCSAPLFTADTAHESDVDISDIVNSPRFIYVPETWESVAINGNSGKYHILAFRPVFIQRTSTNNGPGFEPGPWNNNNAPNAGAAAITSFVFPPPRAGCTPSASDSCGTMLGGKLGFGPTALGENAVIRLVG